jgi:hypothetical protein
MLGAMVLWGWASDKCMEWADKTSTCHQTHNMGRPGQAHRVKVNQVLSGTRGFRITAILKKNQKFVVHAL